ncbi:MAG: hypothetical protein V7742_21295 [Halioglobus sp.]
MALRSLCVFLLALAASPIYADIIGRVVAITDGDTIRRPDVMDNGVL